MFHFHNLEQRPLEAQPCAGFPDVLLGSSWDVQQLDRKMELASSLHVNSPGPREVQTPG